METKYKRIDKKLKQKARQNMAKVKKAESLKAESEEIANGIKGGHATLSKWLIGHGYPLTVGNFAELKSVDRQRLYFLFGSGKSGDMVKLDQWREETQEMWESILPKGTK